MKIKIIIKLVLFFMISTIIFTLFIFPRYSEKQSQKHSDLINAGYKCLELLSVFYDKTNNISIKECKDILFNEGFVLNDDNSQELYCPISRFFPYRIVINISNLNYAVSNSIYDIYINVEDNGRMVEQYGYIIENNKPLIGCLYSEHPSITLNGEYKKLSIYKYKGESSMSQAVFRHN